MTPEARAIKIVREWSEFPDGHLVKNIASEIQAAGK